METRKKIETSFDAIIIGGGPAGSNCALWLKMLGYLPCIIDKRPNLGGLQNESPYPNQWIAVLPGLTGQEVAQSTHEHIKSHHIPLYLNSVVTEVLSIENGYQVLFENTEGLSSALFASHLVLACGVRPASGELTPSNNLLIGPGKQIADYSFTGKKVAILGGGDSAFENYEFIQKKQPELIHIYARHDNVHSIKARCEFLERVPSKNIYCYEGNLSINSENLSINETTYDAIVALYGWTANLPSLSFSLDLTVNGFVKTDPNTAETSQANVYAIGEVAQRAHPCCTTAMADGVVAAKAIQYKMEYLRKQSFLLSFNKINDQPQELKQSENLKTHGLK
jgi:thioredoxin reductase (NADPH)